MKSFVVLHCFKHHGNVYQRRLKPKNKKNQPSDQSFFRRIELYYAMLISGCCIDSQEL